ncbi:MAG: GIY-YIG nuclease family protein [Rhodobacter sp.]|uniref:GIY-YIG nuclease family protein n=1 Tax=Pararhodobacter sp. TaxID=2127056 RepID=UPI001D3B6D6E|nr:GIY-YIG nuclease family protein [Pararhodobacter sp.]MCB1345623.1 GIY-YIG nuclease family protein [Paracoccaceae bacterium]MCC0073110.1 GIY-YIG nuclease family protein [Rhodobacter sp.]HPD93723.1 GIY-YIG nuclease family protein [Pararhodobacter sp.]
MTVSGRSLELYFIDGRPEGMLTAEVFNWTGHVLRVPRLQVVEALRRAETGHTGVYLLIGDEADRPRLYVGETEDLRERLRDHVVKKDWWNTAILITTAGDALHKAHVKYLESRLVEIARDAGKAVLDNGNTPPRSSLSESHVANMEAFLETLLMVLPAIRVDLFLNKATATPRKEAPPARLFEFKMPRHNIAARAELRNEDRVVLAGSLARAEWAGDRRHAETYWVLHDELLANGTIVVGPSGARFATDYAFSSPSAAAAVVAGTARNGRTDWKSVDTGQTYAEWEAAQVTEGTP